MSDFLDSLVARAREVATEVLDKLEEELTGKPAATVEERYEAAVDLAEELEAELSALNEELAEAHLAIKLLLDGETETSFAVSYERAKSLSNYDVTTHWEPIFGGGGTRLVIRQHKL
jgi:hypothetical protein